MNMTSSFNKGIIDMIERHSYIVFLVCRDLDKTCACVDHTTKQANPKCPKCLGTGFKIRIRKIKSAAQDTKVPPSFRSDAYVIARNYFIPSKYTYNKDDLIIDKDSVFFLFEGQELIGLEGTVPYSKVNAVRKRFDSDIFLRNFKKIVGGDA